MTTPDSVPGAGDHAAGTLLPMQQAAAILRVSSTCAGTLAWLVRTCPSAVRRTADGQVAVNLLLVPAASQPHADATEALLACAAVAA